MLILQYKVSLLMIDFVAALVLSMNTFIRQNTGMQ